jgi:hypothetical protein
MIKRGYTTLINASATTTSGELTLKAAFTTLSIQIKGSAANTARTITFEETLDGVEWVPVAGVLKSDLSTIASSTTSKLQTWAFDPSGVAKFRVNLTAITGGTVTVVASFTAED